MYRRFCYVAAMASLVAGTWLADAQAVSAQSSPPHVETAISPSFHSAITKGGKVQSGGVKIVSRQSGEITTNLIAPMFSIGWNTVHINNCLVTKVGDYWWLYAYTDSGDLFFTNIPTFQTTLSSQCSTGNYTAFNVVDSSGTWTHLFTWNYK